MDSEQTQERIDAEDAQAQAHTDAANALRDVKDAEEAEESAVQDEAAAS